ncbi:MAG: rRNA maturation RNase YbeY [Bacteroidales bacterium]|jgi:rRNA maturation RNase YbeY|nr:rRNA maturation RNase YbeY [Bacteroidales bacterium]
MKVKFHYDVERFRLREVGAVKETIARIIADAGLKPGICDVVFTGDEKLYEINREFLGKDYYTDIITFDYKEGKIVNGEIYISVDRVKDNSVKLSETFKSEIRRVIFHGFLHLCGYDDRTSEQKMRMAEMEEMYLALSYAE